MKRLIDGYHRFRSELDPAERSHMAGLARGQSPEYLLITCSDSRLNPGQFTKLAPGELFVIRNAGNLVPPATAGYTGETATIEYAVEVLKVRHALICGHTHCGAMNGLLHPESLHDLPTVRGWLSHAAPVRRAVDKLAAESQADDKTLLRAAIEENVRLQLRNLAGLPSVARALQERRIELHGAIFQFETSELLLLNAESNQFQVVQDGPPGMHVDPAAISTVRQPAAAQA